jgi:SAM-dependent methyltransferase
MPVEASAATVATPDLDRLEARFRTASPVFRMAVSRQLALFGDVWAAALDDLIRRLLPDDESLGRAVDGYSRFALESLRLQRRFDGTGVYDPKPYADVARDVYLDDTYMRSTYLPGLLLSHYLWPHHYRKNAFFSRVFLADRIRAGVREFYDIGVGTGFYSRLALTGIPEARGVGVDISPTSVAFALRHVEAFGAGDRYRAELRDVIARPLDPVASLICDEVLEHLADPVPFIAALRGLLKPGGAAFIATALNAPNTDHIYLYRSAAEVAQQLTQAGFAIEQYFCALAGAPTRPGGSVAEVAAFIVT